MILAALIAAPVAAASIATPAAAANGSGCVPGSIWVNTSKELREFDQHGNLLSSAPLASDQIKDIAFGHDGETLYAVTDSDTSTELHTVDSATGEFIDTKPVTTLPKGFRINAVSALPDGPLLVGGAHWEQLLQIDPLTARTSMWLSARLPYGFGPAGSFLTRHTGDIIALAQRTGEGPSATTSTVFNISPDGVVTHLGSVPRSSAAAQNGGSIYLGGADGNVYIIDELPEQDSSSPIPVTLIAAGTDRILGATARQDAGSCAELSQWITVETSSTPVVTGTKLTYTLHFKNSGHATGEIHARNSLREVLDDADVTSDLTSDGLTVSVNGMVLDISGTVPAHTTRTISYEVTPRDPFERGDNLISNFLLNSTEPLPSDAVCNPADPQSPSCASIELGAAAIPPMLPNQVDPAHPIMPLPPGSFPDDDDPTVNPDDTPESPSDKPDVPSGKPDVPQQPQGPADKPNAPAEEPVTVPTAGGQTSASGTGAKKLATTGAGAGAGDAVTALAGVGALVAVGGAALIVRQRRATRKTR